MNEVETFFAKEIHTKDLGNLKYSLGIEICPSSQGVSLSQGQFVLDLIDKIEILGCKSGDSSMDINTKLESIQGWFIVWWRHIYKVG